MERNKKLSNIFCKTTSSIKRQICIAFTKHTANCWKYYLAFDYKYQGCESIELSKNKLICINRFSNLHQPTLQLDKIQRTKSFECIRMKHEYDLKFKDIYDIDYKSECNY